MSEAEVKALRNKIKKGIDEADVKLLRMVHQIIEIENEKDWWDDLPSEVQASIDEGIKQADKGQVIPHDEFMKRNKKWFSK